MYFFERELVSSDNSINQTEPPAITKVSATSISVRIRTIGMQAALGIVGYVPPNITGYTVRYQQVSSNKKTTIGAAQTVSSVSNPITLTGLVQNATYKIITYASSSIGPGSTMTVFYTLDPEEESLSKISTPKDIEKFEDQKSYLKITGGKAVDDKYSLAYRTFNSIQLPTSTTVERGDGVFKRQVEKYNVGYYSFGTTILMPSLITYEAQGAGIGFFIDEYKGSGYFITIEPSGTAANSNTKPIKIFKLESKQIKQLKYSTKQNDRNFKSIFGGETYNIDVKVRIGANAGAEQSTDLPYKIFIKVNINGFIVTAEDLTEVDSANEILAPTKKVGLLGVSGVSMFDYVYADTINAEKYDSPNSLNFYKGQFSQDYINSSFGNMTYEMNNQDTGNVDINEKKQSYDEFGTVVREIYYNKVKFPGRPSIPIGFTTGANELATIVSQTYNNFGGEVFVLNNTSRTIPLTDNELNLLSVFGYQISADNEIEYVADSGSENVSAEPAVFESKWLHYESDVKKLAEWIRDNVANKARIIEMEVFGNPIISVGDIISVDYPYQGFTSAQKIIVVKVSHQFSGGLTTTIVGRTI